MAADRETRSPAAPEQDLPGFRFHPTEEELLDFYLRQAIAGRSFCLDIIPTVPLYRHEPWELPEMGRGEKEWYFFVPKDVGRRQAGGGRPSRTTGKGFWKATGSDRPVRSSTDPKRLIGLKKTLVYYQGRAPRGTKTDWVMNEYRLPDNNASDDGMVLCKVYRKAVPRRVLEQRAAVEETSSESTIDVIDVDAFAGVGEDDSVAAQSPEKTVDDIVAAQSPEKTVVPEMKLEIPRYDAALEWMQDSFLAQLRSPPYLDVAGFGMMSPGSPFLYAGVTF